MPRFDPFLMLDHFGSQNPEDYLAGFPWHPHRGIETVTYVLSGSVEHGDSIGNAGSIGPGDLQWMSAGSGIIHREMPQDTPDRLQGFQLWVNLPSAKKMMRPRYRDVAAATVPSGNAALLGPGDAVRLEAPAGARLLLVSGRPLGEPVAWGGPIVMNTQEELDLAFAELDRGTFIKHGRDPQ